MMDCLYAMWTAIGRSVTLRFSVAALLAVLVLPVPPAHAVLTADDLRPDPEEDLVEDDVCPQAWPVSCSGGGGDTGCGSWQVLKDLAEAENLPGDNYASCSTGIRLGLGGRAAEGEPVGAMFPGKVVYAQSGRARDGRDYGGVVVIELQLDDGSPQCFARYMFLDRRDLVKTGEEVKPGQRIGSIASSDMNATKDWWQREWNGMQAQVKIDIGCDEALVNMPMFMPREPFSGNGPDDQDSCPLTKVRFPTRPYEYLTSFESVTNLQCSVGARKDARGGLLPAAPQDNSERDAPIGGQYVDKVNPRGFIKHKASPTFSVFSDNDARENLWGANKNRTGGNMLFRDHSNYAHATTLRCENMREIFRGREGESLTPEQVRELMAHCTNQYILGRSMFYQVYEQSQSNINSMREPLPEYLREFLSEEEREEYEDWLDEDNGNTNEVQHLVNKVFWRELCQPLATQPLVYEDYKVRELLTEAWTNLLIDWPEDNDLTPIQRQPIKTVDINKYAEFPYERINDPSHPFSPRHIFAETERERYSDYGVQCAATPVDLILGRYGQGTDDDPFRVFGKRDLSFHQCIRCRIEINETKEACIADPYSFSNAGGCDGGMGAITADGELCSNMPPDLKTHLNQLEVQYGLAPNLLHAVATQESGCSPDAVSPVGAQGMFQFMPGTAAGYGINPWDPFDAAKGSARYYANSANQFSCDLPLMLAAYNCGPGCAAAYQSGQRSSLPTETQGYIERITGMMGGTTDGCSPGGPFPNGNGSSSGGGGGGGSTGGGGGGSGSGLGDVFGGGGGDGSGTGPAGGMGNFDPTACPTGVAGNSNWFTPEGAAAGQKCPPFSYPTPDLPGPGTYGCHGRFFYPPGCDGSCIAHFNGGCSSLNNYNGPTPKSLLCIPGCPGRIHEGMDIAFEYGAPVYASAAGTVHYRSGSVLLEIDHSGECMDPPACTKTFPPGIKTNYLHMGEQRIIVEDGQKVTRCQQIGSVGDHQSEGVPHLHYEMDDPANTMIRQPYTYYALAQDQRFHTHMDDASCTGGVWDAEGRMGNRGICRFALPVEARNKEDLTPPEYYEEYEMSEVTMPNPGSEGHHTKFDLETEGMVYEGAWTECTDSRLTPEARELCEDLNEEEGSEVDAGGGNPPSPTSGSSGFINPSPCFTITSPFGYRVHPVQGTWKLHSGLDIGSPGGSPIFAVADGVVEQSGWSGGCGNAVTIRHSDGTSTRYCHQSSICPQTTVGTTVVQGQVIGLVGTTGNSTGNHLHFEVYKPDPQDPTQFIPAQTPGAPQCAQINSAQCGQTITGMPVGPGVAGGTGKRLCIDHPCSVRYDEADEVAQCAWPEDNGGCGTLGNYSQRHEGSSGDCCYNITAPVTSLNILKMRPGYDNEALKPGATDDEGADQMLKGAWRGVRVDDGLPNGLHGEGGDTTPSDDNPGAPEGYTFHEHFRNHRPFMRWWDTGAESGNVLQEHTDAEYNGGMYDALVGVGIEKSNCGIGGWGDPDQLDGNTSWLELKLYQARSQHMTGLRCISRYEKMFKRGASEDYALRLAGGNFATTLHGTSSSGTTNVEWPLGWRGYVSEPQLALRFPYFVSMFPASNTGVGGAMFVGLDNALPGDILVWDEDVATTKRLPHVAYVTRADNAAMRAAGGADGELTKKRFFPPPERAETIPSVTVMDYNFGKYPDACGNTNWWGVGPERTLYLGRLPNNLDTLSSRKGARTDCGNPDVTNCIENLWHNVKVYRPWRDVRD